MPDELIRPDTRKDDFLHFKRIPLWGFTAITNN
jgi:hypothetical protein